MQSVIRKAAAFLIFLGVLTVLMAANSRTLNLLSICLIGAFGLVASAAIVMKTFTAKPGTSYSRAGWGNPLSVLPTGWRRWLLDERPTDTKKAD